MAKYTPHTCPKCGTLPTDADPAYVGKVTLINNEQAFCPKCDTEFDYATGKPAKKAKKEAPAAKTKKAPAVVERQAPGTYLKPEVVENKKAEEAAKATRKRPVVAVNGAGQSVVCSARTARKHGWKIQPAAPAKAPAQAKTSTKRAERAKKLAEVEDLLG